MKLGGMHHLTMITGDAPKNVEFYADVLGLRMVKKTVNFDAPEHLRPQLERSLTSLTNPRSAQLAGARS